MMRKNLRMCERYSQEANPPGSGRMDAAHFVYGAFLGMVWRLVRVFIPSPLRRKRFNLLGALNAVSKQGLTLTTLIYINAEGVCHFLVQIAQYCGSKPITII
jgi:hypothetical protein